MIPARIAVVGGSTVHGQGDAIGGGFVTRLKTWHESQQPLRHRVFNLGIGGDRIQQMLHRCPIELSARRPNLTILYPGLNDTQRVGSADAELAADLSVIRTQLFALVECIREHSPVILLSAVPLDECRTTPFRNEIFFLQRDAIAMNTLVREVVSYFDVTYLDLNEHMSALPNVPEFLADGLHCNTAGHQLIFDVLKGFLTENFRDGESLLKDVPL